MRLTLSQSYYFVGTSLPDLSLHKKPDVSFQEIKELYRANLTPKDFQQVRKLLYPVDLHNIRAFWLGSPLDERGNLRAHQIEEVLLVQETLPTYLIDYMERYPSTQERLRFFSSLYASLYQEGILEKGFLFRYFTLEREIRLVLTTLRAKEMKRDLLKELQFEDPTDSFVLEILAQKDSAEYTPPFEYEGLKEIFQKTAEDPKRLAQSLLAYRLEKIEEIEEKGPFSLDTLLGYLARLYLIETWWGLDEEKGKETIERLSEHG